MEWNACFRNPVLPPCLTCQVMLRYLLVGSFFFFLTSTHAHMDASRRDSTHTFAVASSCLGKTLIRTRVHLRSVKG